MPADQPPSPNTTRWAIARQTVPTLPGKHNTVIDNRHDVRGERRAETVRPTKRVAAPARDGIPISCPYRAGR